MAQILISNIIRQLNEIQDGSLWFDKSFKDKFDNLSEENRIKFLPSSTSSSFSRDDRKHSPDRHNNNNNNNNNHSPARGGIRHLRDYKLSIAQRELEGRTRGGQGDRNGDRDRDRDRGRSGTIDVSAVVAKVYFSKQYIQ